MRERFLLRIDIGVAIQSRRFDMDIVDILIAYQYTFSTCCVQGITRRLRGDTGDNAGDC